MRSSTRQSCQTLILTRRASCRQVGVTRLWRRPRQGGWSRPFDSARRSPSSILSLFEFFQKADLEAVGCKPASLHELASSPRPRKRRLDDSRVATEPGQALQARTCVCPVLCCHRAHSAFPIRICLSTALGVLLGEYILRFMIAFWVDGRWEGLTTLVKGRSSRLSSRGQSSETSRS